MNPKKSVIRCPECGSKKTKYIDDQVFSCLSCSASFYVETNQTTVNHKHTYNATPKPAPVSSQAKKTILVCLGVFALLFLFFIFMIKPGDNPEHGLGPITNDKAKYTFDVADSKAFIDQSKNPKLFITGSIQSSDYQNNKYKNQNYWAVYDVVKGAYEQIAPVDNNANGSIGINRLKSYKLDDGNIYTIAGETMLFKYDLITKSMQLLNSEIIGNVKELQSGIASIVKTSHNFSAFEIRSNSDKRVTYYPISKLYNTDNFDYTIKNHSYPNDKPTVFFYPTANQPSFLVRYTANYSVGYPFCFNPSIDSEFDENENFKSASFSNYWVTASRLIDMQALNTSNKVYDMTLLDFRDGIVAVAVKTSNVATEKLMIQWQDYDGKLLWSSPSDVTYLYDYSGTISKEHGLLVGSDDKYYFYDNQGTLVKELELEELSFDLD
ncbi:hypothetical protein [Sphingobacterium hungaricum]|uniref:Uncharacterized protein n=1 Tax=Sphingobacterium hungaricum TaxID=2082723 RepID=A0A928YRG3_9SPHI|nr:hypothetical protein [Sphingobacterium hungaricum]MBE8715271.1 hypothetical protein [Sphingobacterium hungaricum]